MNEKAKTENEAEIIMPDQDLIINGETVTVKEFRFREGMMAENIGVGIINAIAALVKDKGDDFSLSDISGIFSDHWPAFIQLLSMSTGKDQVWLEDQDDNTGMTLMNTFWTVNSGFFMRRLISAVMMSRIKQTEISDTVSSSAH